MGIGDELIWQPAPAAEIERLGQEGWPLLDELLARHEDAGPDTNPGHAAQRAALKALIDVAFEP